VPAGPDEERDAEEAHADSRRRPAREPHTEERAVEQRHEERDRRDHQRSDPGADPLLRPGDAARVEDKERTADDRRGTPLAHPRPRGTQLAAPRTPRPEEAARDQEADGEHEKRRQRAVRDRDREVCRAPHDVDDAEVDGELHPRTVPAAW
jgi:hypothetical protein